MNRIAKRSVIVLLLALLWIGGFAFFVAEFVAEAGDWVIFPGSPHIYTGGNIGTGVVLDRKGELLLDLNDGRSYSEDTHVSSMCAGMWQDGCRMNYG